MDFRIAVIFMIALSSTDASAGLRLLFPNLQRQYAYVVKTNVSTGTLTPREVGTFWTLEGKLTVQLYDNFTKARLRLDGLKKVVCCKDDDLESNVDTPDESCIAEPWELEYLNNGYISSIYVGAEPLWCTNLKRAISVNFQLTKNIGTYSVNEPCLDHVCMMVYTRSGNTFKKYTSYKVPSVKSGHSWSSAAYDINSDLIVDSVSSAERAYELDDDKGLMNLDLKGSYQYKTHNHILLVTSDLSLYYDTDVPAGTVEKINLIQKSIVYEVSNYTNPTNGIRQLSQGTLMNNTYEILLRIASSGIDVENIARNPDLIHSLEFINLLNSISQLQYGTLIKLFDNLIVGTSYELETARNIFLEILPHARSESCARLIKYIVLEEKDRVDNDALIALIRKLPFNLASRSQSLLEELEDFSKLGLDFPADIRYAGILSFATLLHKAMEDGHVKQDYFDTLVVKYFRMYGDCPKYMDRMIWLQGLCNIGFSAEYYMRTIHLDSSRDRHERLWASFASNPRTEKPYMVLQSNLPILTNETEFIQLRVLAVHMFLSSNHVRESDFLFVHNFIANCANEQLKRFWYDTVKNLDSNKYFTGYKVASSYIPFIANQVPYPDSMFWATSNNIISSQEENSPSLQALTVGDPHGAFPAFVGLKLSTGGRRPFKADIYLILDGVEPRMFQRLYDYDGADLNADQLVQLLTNLKGWKVKAPKKVHIDVVIKLHDKTVFATHINQSTYDSWNGEALVSRIENFLRFGSHINKQTVYYPYQMDVHLPTELGTPIRLQSTILSLTSLRGTFSALSVKNLSWKNDLNIRYHGTSVTSLSTGGPLVETLHTARIQQSIVAFLPMNFNVSFPSIDSSLGLIWPNPGRSQGGVAMHSRAQVEMEIGTEKYGRTVALGGETQENDEGIFFDCEKRLTVTELLHKLTSPKNYNIDFLTSIQPSMVILNGIIMFARPPSGSCGVILPPQKLLRDGEDVLQVKLALKKLSKEFDNTESVAGLLLDYYSVNDPSDIVLKVDAELKLASQGYDGKIELAVSGQQGTGPLRKDWTFCLREQDISHSTIDQDISPYPSDFDGHLTFRFTPNKTVCFEESLGSELTFRYRGVPKNSQGGLERYFEVQVFGRNLSEITFLDSEIIQQTSYGQLLRSFNQELVNATAVIKEKNGVASLSVNEGREMHFNSESISWLMDYWTDMQIQKSFGLYRECRLQETAVQTFSGTMEQLPPSACGENLVLADCKDLQPRFAIFKLRNGGIKIYSGRFYVSVSGDSEDQSLNVDKTNAGMQFWVTRIADTVKIVSPHTDIEVHYRVNETVVLLPHFLVNTLCGGCVSVDEFEC